MAHGFGLSLFCHRTSEISESCSSLCNALEKQRSCLILICLLNSFHYRVTVINPSSCLVLSGIPENLGYPWDTCKELLIYSSLLPQILCCWVSWTSFEDPKLGGYDRLIWFVHDSVSFSITIQNRKKNSFLFFIPYHLLLLL
jgi:hypothetical protein